MIDPRLLVPVELLPGPVPVGAPVVTDDQDRRPVYGWSPGSVLVAREAGAEWYPAARVALDLSPPDLVDGWPVRVDGLHVAAEMLGRAMRSEGWTGGTAGYWSAAALDRTLQRPHAPGLRVWLPICYSCRRADGWTEAGDRVLTWCCDTVPALADIDYRDPLAERLAMAAVLRAAPWRKP